MKAKPGAVLSVITVAAVAAGAVSGVGGPASAADTGGEGSGRCLARHRVMVMARTRPEDYPTAAARRPRFEG